MNEFDYDINLENENINESLQVVGRILKKAAGDPEFRKTLFLNHQEILKEYQISDEIRYLIVKCLSDLTN